MIFDMLETTPYLTNCYLIGDEQSKTCALVDPGGSRQAVLEMVERSGLRLEKILLTHGHYDHTTGVPELHAALPETKIYIHQEDANGTGGRIFPLAAQVKDLLFYNEGDALPLGGLTVEVLHTPGHSKGSVTLKVRDVLFTGDTLFAGDCGRTDLPGGSYEEILASLGRLGRMEGNFQVCPGHGQTSTMDRERQVNRYLKEGMALN